MLRDKKTLDRIGQRSYSDYCSTGSPLHSVLCRHALIRGWFKWGQSSAKEEGAETETWVAPLHFPYVFYVF